LEIVSDTDSDEETPEKRGRIGTFTDQQSEAIKRYLKPWREQLAIHDPNFITYSRNELLVWRKTACDQILRKSVFDTRVAGLTQADYLRVCVRLNESAVVRLTFACRS
jgi:hypothetical protein